MASINQVDELVEYISRYKLPYILGIYRGSSE